MRRRQRRALAQGLKKLKNRVAKGRLKNRDKILEALGRLKGRYPKARPFVDIQVGRSPVSLTYTWRIAKFRQALAQRRRLPAPQQPGRLVCARVLGNLHAIDQGREAFRVLKSELLLRPIWHHYSGRTPGAYLCVRAGLHPVEDASTTSPNKRAC